MSARALTLGKMQKVVASREKEVTDPPDLGPDQMRLYSYYKPGLVAGEYSITAEQHIRSPSQWGVQELVVKNVAIGSGTGASVPQRFEVMVPHFTLDPAIINSYYPPDGHQDEGRILPHIVFNDPHYPWEILAGTDKRLEGPIDDHDYSYIPPKATNPVVQKVFRNLVPWVALVVFDPEDLHFDSAPDISALGVTGYSDPVDLQKQDPKGIFPMQPKDYFAIAPSSRVNYGAEYPDTAQGKADFTKFQNTPGSMNVIFPKKSLFTSIFGGQISNPTSTSTAGGTSPMSVLESQKYMAHVRHINTIGFPDAGVEEEGLFSIVVSSRTGKVDIDQPQTQICHLVSIEHFDATLGDWIDKQTPQVSDRVALVSLFSWIYTALPPNPVNFVDTVRNLVNNQQMLNVDKQILKQLDNSTESSTIITERLKQGYTLSRWRAQSGEETAAFNRGPLVPGPVPHPVVGDIPDCSETAQVYQILDPQSGLMDLSYSSAWQLGKVLAISDTSFSSALMRFRSKVHNTSLDQGQMLLSSMETKATAVKKMKSVMGDLKNMSTSSSGTPNRFREPAPRHLSIQDPEMKSVLKAAKEDAVTNNASAGSEVYNEFNAAKGNNTDWAIIHTWLCEKLSLGGIPPQYLLPEPSFLPPESLRFFHIDDFWLDCFIDGALSVANHLESDDDVTRRRIKEIFNQYLENPVPRAGYKPQIPSCGFLIRSKLIKAMPDLRITVTWKKLKGAADGDDQRAPVCRWTKWDDETLMALLDRDTRELDSIVLAQPPHQQRFSLGSYVKKGHHTDSTDIDLVQFDMRRLYTSNVYPTDKEWPEKPWPAKGNDGSDWTQRPTTWLNFDDRVLRVGQMAQDITDALQFSDATTGEAYSDLIPNSCVLGLELNDPSYYFKITPPPPNNFEPTTDTQRKRKLYVKSTQKVAAATAAKMAIESVRARPVIASPNPTSPKISTTLSQRQVKTAALTKATSNLSSKKPPSTQTRIQPLLTTRVASTFAFNNGPLTTTSKFQLKVYPDYKTTPTRFPGDKYDPDDYIPSLNIYLFDLIFSLQKPVPSEQNLLWIDIDIPLRTNPASKTKESLLDSNYSGPGLRMLSNQRFIPFLFFDEVKEAGNTADTLHIELRPRSATDGFFIRLNDKKTSEISFRLAEAPISQLDVLSNVNVDGRQVSRGKVVINMTEWYKTISYPGGEPVRSTYVLLKRAVTDDKDWDPFK